MFLKSFQQQFLEEGYLIFPQVFKGEELERLRSACDHALAQFIEEHDREFPNQDFVSMRHLNDSKYHRDRSEHFKIIMETVSDPRCLGPVEQIFAGPSLFRCTSYFVNPRFESKEGDWHRDSQFLGHSEQEEQEIIRRMREEQVIGAIQFQIPLIDNEDIEFVPYSPGRFDSPEEYYIRLANDRSHAREEGMPNAMRVKLKAGDAVIFNPFGLHRGRYHTDIPRKTLMLTYTPINQPSADSFTYQPWFEEEGYLKSLSLRCQAYFSQFVHIYRDSWKK